MKFEFNVTGSERKALVKAMSEILNAEPRYIGMPSMNYEVDYFTITPNGTLELDGEADNEEIRKLLKDLYDIGFAPLSTEAADSDSEMEPKSDTDETATALQSENVALTVAMPRKSFTDDALQNLQKLIDAKGNLIKKALTVDSLPIEVNDEKISFPWFPDVQDSEAADAYTHFITALCDMAKNQKRITAKEKSAPNEKYAFRCFLLRLGFIGSEYKKERKILLSRLDGNSAFKSGAKKEEAAGEISE